jgi:hypothetical protein
MNDKPVSWNGRFRASYKLSFSNKAYDRQIQRGRLSGNRDSHRINKSWIAARLSAFLNLHGLAISSATVRQQCVTFPLTVSLGLFNYLDVIWINTNMNICILSQCNWISNQHAYVHIYAIGIRHRNTTCHKSD